MSYETVNKKHSNKIQDLAIKIVNALKENDNDITTIDSKDGNELIKLLTPKLVFYIRKYITNEKDVEDVLNNSLFKIYSKIWKYNFRYRFTTWAFAITINEIKTHYNQQTKQKEHTLQFSSVMNSQLYIDSNDDYYIPNLKKLDFDKLVMDEIYNLPDNVDKKIIVDTHLNRMKIKEIAFKYKINENTIKTKQKKIRSNIREILLKTYPDLKNITSNLI